MSRTPRKLALFLALSTCTAGVLTACGSDDDATTDTTVTTVAGDSTTDPTTAPTDDQTGDLAAFCDPYVEVTLMMNGEPDPEALTTAVDAVITNAPDDIADSVKVMTDAVGTVLDSGGQDFSALQSPEFIVAQGEVDPFVFDNCDIGTPVEVTGIDFGFEGLPDELTSGRHAVLFTNDGAEAHEIGIMRRNDGVTESWEELLALPEEEAMEKVTPVGGAFAASTGSKALAIVDLEAGDYLAICFIPSGSTVTDGNVTEGTGDPHFVHGMQQEFTVS